MCRALTAGECGAFICKIKQFLDVVWGKGRELGRCLAMSRLPYEGTVRSNYLSANGLN